MFLNKHLSDISSQDIESLIDNTISESQTLDFKSMYDLSGDDSKGKFLADISAFANSQGGDLIFGIYEEEGIAKKVEPLVGLNFDDEKRKIEQLVMAGIEPRVKIQIKEVPVTGGHALIIRTMKSHIAPHRVIFTGYSKTKNEFYGRNSAGNFQLNVTQLRESFLLSERTHELVDTFINKRIIDIYSESISLPLPLPTRHGKIIMHLIPLGTFGHNEDIVDIKEFGKMVTSGRANIKPMGYIQGWNYRTNFDGYLLYSPGHGIYSANPYEYTQGYTQIFRNGTIEGVNAHSIYEREKSSGEKYKSIPSLDFEQELILDLTNYLSFIKQNNLELPIYLSLTIVGAKGYGLGVQNFGRSDTGPIDRDILPLSSCLIENYETPPSKILQPFFDVLWQTCGYSGSIYYNQDGTRRQ